MVEGEKPHEQAAATSSTDAVAAEPPTEEESMSDTSDRDAKLSRNLRDAINNLLRIVNSFPLRGGPYELYSTNKTFAQLVMLHRKRATTLIGSLYANLGVKIELPKVLLTTTPVVEGNNFLAERIAFAIDKMRRSKNRQEVMVPSISLGAEAHTGIPKLVPGSAAYGKDSRGKYAAFTGEKSDLINVHTGDFHHGLFVLKNIAKPQEAFRDTIVNDDAPFVSKLRIKHHVRPRREGMRVVDDEGRPVTMAVSWKADFASTANPYEYEIDCFAPSSNQLTEVQILPVKTLYEVPLSYIDTREALEALVQVLNKTEVFAVDLEHHHAHSFLGLTCLIQISTFDTDYIVDPFPLWRDIHILNEPFTDPNIIKIFHNCEQDVLWLQRDFGVYVVNAFDTYLAMKTLQMSRLSYQYLVDQFFGVTLRKELQKADWRLRPLTDDHIQYARSDTHYLIHAYLRLRNELIKKSTPRSNLLAKLYEAAKENCRSTFQQPRFSEDGYHRLATTRLLNNQQVNVMKSLWRWRDQVAREVDEAYDFVLSDHSLCQIADILPQEVNGIYGCCSHVSVFLKRDIMLVQKMIREARALPLEKTFKMLIDSPFARHIIDVHQKSVIEQRIEELFTCDCNEDNNVASDVDVDKATEYITYDNDVAMSFGQSTDYYVIQGSLDENKRRENVKLAQSIRDSLDESYTTPYEAYELAYDEYVKNQAENEKIAAQAKQKPKPEPAVVAAPPMAPLMPEGVHKLQLTVLSKRAQKRRKTEGGPTIYTDKIQPAPKNTKTGNSFASNSKMSHW